MSRKVFERYLKEDEERKLFATVKRQAGRDTQHQLLALRDHAWLRLLRNTGIRVGTLAGLNVADARQALASNYLQIRPEIAKRGQGGKVFCNRAALKALRTLLAVRKRQGAPEKPEQPLVLSRKHARMAVRSYQQRMQLWVRDAGLDVQASPHWLRHTLAKRVMKNSTAEDPRGIVQGALGHTNASSTWVYTMPDREDVEATLEQVAG